MGKHRPSLAQDQLCLSLQTNTIALMKHCPAWEKKKLQLTGVVRNSGCVRSKIKKKVAKCFKYGWWVENGGHRVFATLGNQDYGSDQTMIGGQQIVQGTS